MPDEHSDQNILDLSAEMILSEPLCDTQDHGHYDIILMFD
jgi:hypothetical protein